MSVQSLGAARAGVIAVAAASALALLALPSAAHAAEVVTCTPTVTAASQPWLTFSESENLYAPFETVLAAYVGTSLDLTENFPDTFTADDLDEYEQALIAAEETFASSLESIQVTDSLILLAEQLEAVDPDDAAGSTEKLAALTDAFADQADVIGFQQALQSFESTQQAFSDSASALVEADEPVGGPFDRPAIPASLETDRDATVAALQQIAETYQTVVLDGAVAYVVYEDVCVTTIVADAPTAVTPAKTLAATGTSDGIALGTTAGLLLLVGAAVTAVTVRRRRSA
jgi:hypothetical protein